MLNCGGKDKLNQEELDLMFKLVDVDNDGQISYSEFLNMLRKKIDLNRVV